VVSASRLNCFHSCRIKFYFRYVLELIKPPTAALFVGKAVHAALQQWSTARWRGQPHDAESLKAGFLMNWITEQEEGAVSWEADEEEQQAKAWGLVAIYGIPRYLRRKNQRRWRSVSKPIWPSTVFQPS
jgi:putative RecB family exonuclease